MQETERSVVSLGAYLRSLREAKGGSLEDMARSTRVGIRHLEALEEERLADLPSPVFVRGFIRAYCGFLRESPETALGHYQSLAGEWAAAAAASAPPRPRTTWANSSVLVGAALLVILGAGLFVLKLTVKKTGGNSIAATQMESPGDPPAPPRPAAAPPPPAASPPPPVANQPAAAVTPEPLRPQSPPAAAPATPPPASVAAKAAPAAGGQRLMIRAVEPTWVRVQTDDGRVAEELLSAGVSREWTAERRFVLTIGNAGGVELTLNGKALAPLGAKGTVIQRLELPPPPGSSGS